MDLMGNFRFDAPSMLAMWTCRFFHVVKTLFSSVLERQRLICIDLEEPNYTVNIECYHCDHSTSIYQDLDTHIGEAIYPGIQNCKNRMNGDWEMQSF